SKLLMTTLLVHPTQFVFPHPKQFYRKVEDLFRKVDKLGPAENVALKFLKAFRETLAVPLGVATMQLYERDGGPLTLLRTCGDSADAFPREFDGSIFCCEEFPWIGELGDRKAAVIPFGEERSLWMVFFAQQSLSSDPFFIASYASAFSSLHYALVQNLK